MSISLKPARTAVAALVALCICMSAEAAPKAWLVYDAKNFETLALHNESVPVRPASLAKLMTAYLLLGALERGSPRLTWETSMTASRNASRQPPTRIGIKHGNTITVRNALLALVVQSANDVAVTVAEHLAGSETRFVKLMNFTAHDLGMYRTHYANASGLPDPNQFTTAVDTAILVHAIARRFPAARGLLTSRQMSWKGRQFRRGHSMLKANVPVLKTGFTCHSGYNVAFEWRTQGRHLVTVVLGAASAGERDAQARRIVNAASRQTRPIKGHLRQLRDRRRLVINRRDLATRCR